MVTLDEIRKAKSYQPILDQGHELVSATVCQKKCDGSALGGSLELA